MSDEPGRLVVSYDDGVYDVSDFASHHPGGPLINMANGGPLESMWCLYRVHFKRPVYNLLEKFRIGVLAKEDRVNFDDLEDPFNAEPVRHPGLMVLRQKPFDAETPLNSLAQGFYTRNNVFYVRNHFPVPLVEEPDEHEIEVIIPKDLGGKGDEESTVYKFGELRDTFKFHEFDAALFCTGFRAKEMTEDPYDAQGGQMGNARWGGFRVRDLLLKAGLDEELVFSDTGANYHAHLRGLDGYEISIPLEVACRIDRDVLIATEMNGVRLPRDHGFPCRVLVPSFVGARSVKWIESIEVKKEQSTSPFHANIYRLWSKDVHNHEECPLQDTQTPSVCAAPINSVILSPQNGDEYPLGSDEPLEVKGIALSSGGRDIVKVEVFVNGKWLNAKLHKSKQHYGRHWAWTEWSITVAHTELHPDEHGFVSLACRAVDDAYGTQPAEQVLWNMRGFLANNYHHVTVHVSEAK